MLLRAPDAGGTCASKQKLMNASGKKFFKQIKGICSVDKTLFVTDVSAGEVKIVTRLGETISFLKILGSLYDTFGIHSRDMKLFIETSLTERHKDRQLCER